MTERWIDDSEQLLKVLKRIVSKKGKDRLDIINSLLLTLNALERSVSGWRMWVNNLSLMSQFTLEELEEMNRALYTQVEPIVVYDLEVTKKWRAKFPQRPIIRRTMEEEKDRRGIYV